MTKKLLMVFVFGLMFISLASSVSIGNYAKNSNVTIYQTCNDCNSCSFSQIKYPNGTSILSNVNAIQDNSYFYYQVLGGNHTRLGTYSYCYSCTDGTYTETGCLDYEITLNGFDIENSESLIYFSLMIILSIFFLISLIAFVRKEWDPNGDATKLLYYRIGKLSLGILSYVLLMFIFLVGKTMTMYISYFDSFYTFFRVGLIFVTIGIIPVGVVAVFLTVISIVTHKKMIKDLERGFMFK